MLSRRGSLARMLNSAQPPFAAALIGRLVGTLGPLLFSSADEQQLPYLPPSLRQFMEVELLADDIMSGQRAALSRGITLAESSRPDHQLQAAKLLRELQKRMVAQRHLLLPSYNSHEVYGSLSSLPSSRQSSAGAGGADAASRVQQQSLAHTGGGDGIHHPSTFRIGFSGPPGAGKSSLIEALGCRLVDSGDKVAVLAIDPSSQRSGGAILGDKTRMGSLSASRSAYVRPTPARGTLGGVARSTCDAMLICEAAGYNKVLVETVGVGQSETAVVDLVDCLVLVLPPMGGDELQVIKRGITEVADIVVINKADGPSKSAAARAAASFRSTLHFHRQRRQHWKPSVLTASAHSGAGLQRLQEEVEDYRAALGMSGELAQLRREQRQRLAWTAAEEAVLEGLRHNPQVEHVLRLLMPDILDGRLAPRSAGEVLASVFSEYD